MGIQYSMYAWDIIWPQDIRGHQDDQRKKNDE